MSRPATTWLLAHALLCACPGWWTPTGSNALETATTDITTSTTDPTTGEPPPTTTATTGLPDLPGEPDPCATLDPEAVYVHGRFDPGDATTRAIARVDALDAPCVGFASQPIVPRVHPLDGRLLMIDGLRIAAHVPDPLVWDDVMQRWSYPEDPAANDETVLVPDCAPGQLSALHIHPGDGRLIYACGLDERTYHDEDGSVLYTPPANDPLQEVLAISRAGTLLLLPTVQRYVTRLRHLPAGADDDQAVTLPPDIDGESTVFSARLRGGGQDGFWLVVLPDGEQTLTRWTITDDGVATVDGTFHMSLFSYQSRLSGDGDLVYFDSRYLARSPLLPMTADLLYDADEAPEPTWPYDPGPFFYVGADFGELLFSGP